MSVWHLYILQSETTGRLYTGITVDLERRLKEHNSGTRGAKYTRIGRPWRIAYSELLGESQGDALRRELAVKKLSRKAKLRLAGLSGTS